MLLTDFTSSRIWGSAGLTSLNPPTRGGLRPRLGPANDTTRTARVVNTTACMILLRSCAKSKLGL